MSIQKQDLWIDKKCEFCENEFHVRRSSKKRFCNRSCSNSWQHANGIRKIGFDITRCNYEKWIAKYGKDKADELDLCYRKNMSDAIRKADMTYQNKIAKQTMKERNEQTKGKKLEEIYGFEKAAEIRKKLSSLRKGSKNPAFGKSYAKGGKSIKGYYKEKFFRSLLEYSFMKHLESIGRSIDRDVEYECFTVPYLDEGIEKTYRVDFYDKVTNTVYEVKPSYILSVKSFCEAQIKKWEAAKEYFRILNIEFKIVTEENFRKISFDEALKDPDVIWKEETFSYFKRKKAQ